MEKVFWGNYFDGNSYEPYSAQIVLGPSQLQIIYQVPSQHVPVTVYWQPSRIQVEPATNALYSILHYGKHPAQILEVTDPDFKVSLNKQYAPPPAIAPPVVLPASRIRTWFWTAAAILVGLVIGFYFWGLPFLADKIAQIIPLATDKYIGQQLYRQVAASTREDSALTNNVRGFLRQLRLNSPYQFHVSVIREKNPNAFALPGGYIVVQSGLLNQMQQPEELAALLGHEMGHVQNRHTTRAMFRSLAGYLFISFVLGDVAGISTVILQNADMLKRLEYSRKLEQEADNYGYEILKQNHINPQGLILLFQRLKKQEKTSENSAAEDFLSTHPPLESRQNNIRKMMKEQSYTIQPPDSLLYFWYRIKQVEH